MRAPFPRECYNATRYLRTSRDGNVVFLQRLRAMLADRYSTVSAVLPRQDASRLRLKVAPVPRRKRNAVNTMRAGASRIQWVQMHKGR